MNDPTNVTNDGWKVIGGEEADRLLDQARQAYVRAEDGIRKAAHDLIDGRGIPRELVVGALDNVRAEILAAIRREDRL